MKLLIDAGNSRVKWAVHDGRGWLAQGAVEHGDIASLAEVWRQWPITAAWGASVARADVARGLKRPRPADCSGCGQSRILAMCATNIVIRPSRGGSLAGGVGRAAAASGRCDRRLCRTALTVEALTAEGDYLGGLILPGLNLMLSSLARNTANLGRPAGVVTPFPQGTEDALASGAVYALTGAVESQRRQLQMHTGRASVRVLLTGGDAARLAPWLAGPVEIVDNLVLLGLLRVADEK